MNLRTYQQAAAAYLAARRHPSARALVICPAGGGKTIIAAYALATVQAISPCVRIGWVCNTREQVEQGQNALNRCKVRAEFVACVAGITPARVAHLDILLIDECHHLMAETWHALAESCKGAVWGLTATPLTGDEDRDAAFRAFWGGRAHVVKRDVVMEGGHLAKGCVRIVNLDTRGEFDEELSQDATESAAKMAKKCPHLARTEEGRKTLLSRALWQSTIEHLKNYACRNRAVVCIAQTEVSAGESVLILVGQIEHGEHLAGYIEGAVLAHSKMGAKRRREAIDAFRDGSLRCLIATSLADEGLDVPRASVLILACAGRSSGKLEQRTGRVMRPSAGKGMGIVYDFADKGASMAHAQHRARIKTYRLLGYTVEPAAVCVP